MARSCEYHRRLPLLLMGLVFVVTVIPKPNYGEASSPNYMIGVGSHDITGPAADVNMMGYANPAQNAAGIHMRLRARAFIVAESSSSNGGQQQRVVFVNTDACMASTAVTLRVLARLKDRYGDLYTEKNVAISGTHTHSGPGGYLQYVLYIVTSLGFVRQSFDALVNGIEQAIVQAHNNLRPGSIFFNEGELLETNINRSPSAYLNNPAEERAMYKYDVDKNMSLLKFVDEEWGPVGSFSWFPVHGTSMNRTNELISSDNKGAASRFMEDWFAHSKVGRPSVKDNASIKLSSVSKQSLRRKSSILGGLQQVTEETAHNIARSIVPSGGMPTTRMASIMHRVRSVFTNPLDPPFVAAFCQSNEGDNSPNVLGAFCLDSGLPCDFNHSTCNGRNELCVGRGPAYPEDHFASTKIIGQRQSDKAIDLFQTATKKVDGKIGYRQAYVDMSSLGVMLTSGEVVSTCPAAVGFSFAAGTTDGPGAFDFTQGDNKGNLFWKIVGGALRVPSQEQVNCQQPKPVLIDTGEMFTPYAWAVGIVTHSWECWNVEACGASYSDITNWADHNSFCSWRVHDNGWSPLRRAVRATLLEKGGSEFQDAHIIIAGLTGSYSQYITTFEEYEMQRYEGASTLYGPHTLSGYIQEFEKLATSLVQDTDIAPGPSPPDLLDKQLGFLPGVVADGTPSGVDFGDCKDDVPANSSYKAGDTVYAQFYTGCPRNDLLTEGTYALVEVLDATAKWQPAYDDDDWSVKYLWSRPMKYSTYSFGTVEWTVPESAQPGVYRIRHFGAYKRLFGGVKHFTGTSSAFVVTI